MITIYINIFWNLGNISGKHALVNCMLNRSLVTFMYFLIL